MDIIISFLIFFFSIFIHELGHIMFSWIFSKELPNIRFRKIGIMVIPKTVMSIKQVKWFLGGPVIAGMFAIVPFFFYYPLESWAALTAYFFSCAMDFYNLMILEVKYGDNKK